MSSSMAPEDLDPEQAATVGMSELSVGINEVLRKLALDESEEWEYEYSTTARETYYLTVELSYPDFVDKSSLNPHHSRGGYYKNWLGKSTEGLHASEGALSDREDAEASDDHVAEANNAGEAEANNEEVEDMPFLDPMLRAHDEGGATSEAQQAPEAQTGADQDKEHDANSEEKETKEDIQILELHSHHPIISYRGRIFEGDWAEVVGTEVILAKHDDTLPALRNMADGIDFLAASASRIMTTEKVLKPKDVEQDSLAAVREEWNIRIPSLRDKTGERKEQARFLENLIALKKEKGHTDNVTVYATNGEGKNWDDRRGLDYKPRGSKRRVSVEGEDKRLRTRQKRRPMQGARRLGFSKDDATSQLAGIYKEMVPSSALQAGARGHAVPPEESFGGAAQADSGALQRQEDGVEYDLVGCDDEWEQEDATMADYG